MGLETYVIEPRTLVVAGKVVQVAPLKIRQIPAFVRAIRSVIGPLSVGDLISAVTVGGEDLILAVAIATGEQEDWVGNLDADEFILLAGEVVEVNADFFVHRLTPVLEKVSAKTTEIIGGSPSPGSVSAGTATTNASTSP